MLSVANKPIIMSVTKMNIVPSVANKPIMLSVVMLNAIMMNVMATCIMPRCHVFLV
jgi:hypothetical protein